MKRQTFPLYPPGGGACVIIFLNHNDNTKHKTSQTIGGCLKRTVNLFLNFLNLNVPIGNSSHHRD